MNKNLNSLIVVVIAISAIKAGHPDPDDDFACSNDGRFADERDTTCKLYHLCSPGLGGKWVKTSYSCPEGTIFDADIGHCSSSATCKHHDRDSSESSSEYDGDDFICKRVGVFDDINDPFCRKYYECKKTPKGFFSIQKPCPPPSKFDPHHGHCSNHYTCPRQFKCTRIGRFDDSSDDYNKRYFLCLKKKNGEFAKTVYTCPLYSRFDAEYEICAVPDDSSSDADENHDHTLPVENWEHLDSFTCKKRGFFTQDHDENCKTFYFCDITADGKLAKFILSCPRGYVWNSEINVCSPGHHCD